jgi:hypothetical protein
MCYKADLKQCEVLLNGLLLPSNLFVTKGKIQAYYNSSCLGQYEVKKVIKNLDKFNKEMQQIENARREDLALSASLGITIAHLEGLDEIARRLAEKYFSR